MKVKEDEKAGSAERGHKASFSGGGREGWAGTGGFMLSKE